MNRTERVMEYRVVSWLRHRGDCEDDQSDKLKRRWDATMSRFLEERQAA